MPLVATPLTTAFELQRTAIQQTRDVFDTTVEFHTNLNEILLDGFEEQQSIQRRLIAIQHVVAHRLVDRVEEDMPVVDAGTDQAREVLDEQFTQLYDNHEQLFRSTVDEFATSVDAYDDVSEDYLAALDEQLALLIRTQEEVEGQSVETAEQVDEQLLAIQEGISDLRGMARSVTA